MPCGAASIGEAHRATLRDGREVVVKVQYPNVGDLFDVRRALWNRPTGRGAVREWGSGLIFRDIINAIIY